MGLSSLQVCMDTSEWMQGTVHEERGVDSPPLEEMFTCSRPLLERRLRPQPDPALKCPRCDSTNTKFCYYNNYSLSQPRYFCKTCRRYWTKGGSLRNVPVGGGCRKNKRVAVKKTQDQGQNQLLPPSSSSQEGTDLHLSFSGVQLSHLDTMFGTGNPRNHDFMEGNMLGNPRGHDFMETKFGIGHLGGHEGKYYGTELGALCEGLGSGEMGFVGGNSDVNNHGLMGSGFHGFCSSLGMNNGGYIEGGGRLDFPFEYENRDEMKPRIHVSDNQSNKPLCIEWQEHDNCEGSKDPSGYWSGLGTWSGLMNNCGTSSALPLVQNLD